MVPEPCRNCGFIGCHAPLCPGAHFSDEPRKDPLPDARAKEFADAPPDIQNTLTERGKRYGDFAGHALVTQQLKDDMRIHKGWERLSDSQMEALEMIAHKIGRILNGDPNYLDSWHDIVGYAQLVCNQLQEKK